MVRLPLTALLAASALTVPAAVRAAAPVDERAFRSYVSDLVAAGEMGFDEGLLARFQRVFAPGDLPAALAGPAEPARSATLLLHEYRRLRGTLHPHTVAAIDAQLGASGGSLVHTTPHFRLTYDVQGAHAVPGEDLSPRNGVPDFVERIGTYAETALWRLVADAGFSNPVPPGGLYEITFLEMSAFGYTEPAGDGTRIRLHRNFEGFPPNADPEGSERGAAKVAVAHELKHASQYAASGWTERGWLEADAMWAEDFVFDATDDYLRYLFSGSPVSDPDGWLPNGTASYEDCLFQHVLVESHGAGILVDFFARRGARPGESVPETFDAVLRTHGSSLESAVERLGVWSYFCGANAWQRPVGFEEAVSYPTPPVSGHLRDATETRSDALPGMGSHFVVVGPGGRAGRPWIQFLGDRTRPYAVTAVTIGKNGTRSVVPVPVTTSSGASFELPGEWGSIAFLSLVLTNLEPRFHPGSYHVSVDDQSAVGVTVAASQVAELLGNRPNPFRSSTRIAFSLPVEQTVRLSVYDVGGRLIRRLVEGGSLGAGFHERAWDGMDDAGRPAAAGVYTYRLETAERADTGKMLLIR